MLELVVWELLFTAVRAELVEAHRANPLIQYGLMDPSTSSGRTGIGFLEVPVFSY